MKANIKVTMSSMLAQNVRATLNEMMRCRGCGAVQWNDTNGPWPITGSDSAVYFTKSLGEKAMSKIPEGSVVVHSSRQRAQPSNRYELFHVDELQFVLPRHPCVPHHRLVPDADVRDIEAVVGTREKFPVLLHTDPVVRFYGWQPGQVVHVNRRYRIIR